LSLLEVKDLKKFFPAAGGLLHAVDGVNLSVEDGKTLGIVGESGCGKTTLGKTVVRLEEPTSGEIWYDGTNIAAINARQFMPYRTKMQMIFQDPFSSLDPRMSVSQIIGEPLRLFRICKSKEEYIKRIRSLMDTVGIASRLENAYPHEMDGGRRQRVGIARALALNPRLIVCDEPVSALDVSIQAQVLNLLQDLQQEKKLTYLFITHDLSVIRHISNEICVMYLGQVVEQCETKELFRHTIHPYSQALLSAIPSVSVHNRKKRIILRGEITSPINPTPCCRFAPRCNYAQEQCFACEPQLQDAGNGHLVSCHKSAEFSGAISPAASDI